MLPAEVTAIYTQVAKALGKAHAVGIVVPVFTSYLGHKHWSFK